MGFFRWLTTGHTEKKNKCSKHGEYHGNECEDCKDDERRTDDFIRSHTSAGPSNWDDKDNDYRSCNDSLFHNGGIL